MGRKEGKINNNFCMGRKDNEKEKERN